MNNITSMKERISFNILILIMVFLLIIYQTHLVQPYGIDFLK